MVNFMSYILYYNKKRGKKKRAKMVNTMLCIFYHNFKRGEKEKEWKRKRINMRPAISVNTINQHVMLHQGKSIIWLAKHMNDGLK